MGREITKCTKVPKSGGVRFMEWEVLGLLFCSFTSGIMTLEEHDLFFADPSEPNWTRRKALIDMKSCVEMCIELCGNS
ncbi:hypothetical protein HYALB_00012323 [Hymenoscyphus albidus]|uniref:Uncharacterized protein n=1 Tax=Hymenoscyphus albidus TaxID=595503 RepID=A0A9N9LHQ2_9HELO|nr:hypothetical protein HYALB_00012323 [Hymenoscyphus albidus]